MSDVKVSGLPPDSVLDGNHYVILNDPAGPTTKRTLLSTLAAFFFNQANIPDGSGSPRTRSTEAQFDYIASGLVWSGDSYGSTRAASMTSGTVYINGRRITVSAVVARVFTASKDTYIDLLDNGDGTGTLVYTEVANNAASPTLSANSIRIGIIITGAANIANVGSVNQGQEDKVLPIVSQNAYSVTDSLGNLIAPRDPNRLLLGMKVQTVGSGSSGGTPVEIVQLACIVKVPTGRKIRAMINGEDLYTNTNNASGVVSMWEGAVNSGRQLSAYRGFQNGSSGTVGIGQSRVFTPLTTNPTIRVGLVSAAGGTATMDGAANAPVTLEVWLV